MAIAQALRWRYYAARLLILITDAPGHGWVRKHNMSLKAGSEVSTGYVDESCDSYPIGYPPELPTRLDAIEQAKRLAADGVVIYTVGVEPHASQTAASTHLQAIAAAGNGMSVQKI